MTRKFKTESVKRWMSSCCRFIRFPLGRRGEGEDGLFMSRRGGQNFDSEIYFHEKFVNIEIFKKIQGRVY